MCRSYVIGGSGGMCRAIDMHGMCVTGGRSGRGCWSVCGGARSEGVVDVGCFPQSIGSIEPLQGAL